MISVSLCLVAQGAIVVQIHGALRGEIQRRDALKYGDDWCSTRLGIHWAAYLADGWNRTYPDESDHADFTIARVDPTAFGAFVRRALVDGDFAAMRRELEHAHWLDGARAKG